MARRAGEAAADIARGGFSGSPQARARGAPGRGPCFAPRRPSGRSFQEGLPAEQVLVPRLMSGLSSAPPGVDPYAREPAGRRPPGFGTPMRPGNRDARRRTDRERYPPRYTGLPPYRREITPARPRRVTPVSLAAWGQVSLPGRGPPRALQQVVRRRHRERSPGSPGAAPRAPQPGAARDGGARGAGGAPGEPPRYQGPPGGSAPWRI